MDELRYAQKSSNLFDPKISSFVNSALLLKEIETKIAGQRDEIPENDPFCEGKISNLESEKAEQLESLEMLKKAELKSLSKGSVKPF